jgi:stringent starvation protein B
MLSNKPYLLRAFYQWIVDSGCTPLLVMNSGHPQLKVPAMFKESEETVFNISPDAIRDLEISNETVEFRASFSGVIHIICAPLAAILAIYAEENGEGIFFDPEEEGPIKERTNLGIVKNTKLEEEENLPPPKAIKKDRSFLKLVE